MQTLTLNIQDSFIQDFLHLIEPYHDKIEIQKDKNLEYNQRISKHSTMQLYKKGQTRCVKLQQWGKVDIQRPTRKILNFIIIFTYTQNKV